MDEKYPHEQHNAPWVGQIVNGELVVFEVSQEEYERAIWPKKKPPFADAKD